MNEARKTLFTGLKDLRNFFSERDFLEVAVPPMVPNPGMEVHIHPFRVAHAKDKSLTNMFLQTSPEFYMKELLSEGFEKIFNISYCFRDEPESTTHRPQFLMIEWYRAHEEYSAIVKDCEDLALNFPDTPFKNVEKVKVADLFREYCKFDILQFLDTESLYEKIKNDFSEYTVEKNLPWEDLFFILFLNKIEPEFKNFPALIVDEYPAPLSALSTLNPNDERVCQRFELYLNGIEVANCFNELTNLDIQKSRFEADALKKKELYGYDLPKPSVLYDALEMGIPKSAGIAMGVERFLMAIHGREDLFFD